MLLLFFAMPHTKAYKKYQLGGSDIYDLYSEFCPTTWRNIPWLYALPLDGSRSCPAVRLASSAPRPDGAAGGCLERPCRCGRAAGLCEGQGGRDQQRRSWPWKGFRVVLGVSLARWRKGFVHGQVIFCYALGCWVVFNSYLLLKDPLLWWDGPLEIRVKEMRWNE